MEVIYNTYISYIQLHYLCKYHKNNYFDFCIKAQQLLKGECNTRLTLTRKHLNNCYKVSKLGYWARQKVVPRFVLTKYIYFLFKPFTVLCNNGVSRPREQN